MNHRVGRAARAALAFNPLFLRERVRARAINARVAHAANLLWLFAFLALLLQIAPAQAGSPFYLTVERAFSNEEKPQARLDYTVTDKPLLVRVLRPRNLEKFLDGQFNISRSYEEPTSELNPGHYFVKGLNEVESPMRLFRGLLNKDFRASLRDSSFNKAIVTTTTGPLATPPEQILVAPPKGFDIEREVYIDLQAGDQTAQDLGWWFGQSAWSESRYKVRSLSLDPLPDGVYLLQAVQGKTEAQCLIQVSSLAVQIKQSSAQLLARVMNRHSAPIAAARVSFRDGRGRWIALPNPTDANGETRFDNPEGTLDGKLVVKVGLPPAENAKIPREALTVTDFLPTQTKDDSVFIMTDRPIFKPGDAFHFKGLVRNFEQGQLKIPPFQSRQADISIYRTQDPASSDVIHAPLTDFGSFSGELALDEAQTPGLYRVLAEIDRKAYAGEFRVRDYVKPTFYLELLERSPAVAAGQPFKLKFRAKRYSGGAPQDVKFEVFLYRKKFEAPQFVTEAGGGLSAGNDYFGQVKSAAPLTQPQRLFSSIEQREAADSANSWESAPAIEPNGEAEFEFTVPADEKQGQTPQEWIYTLMLRAQDAAGGQAILAENIYATLSEATPALRFDRAIVGAGETGAKLLVQSSYADGKPAPKAGGAVDLTLERPGSVSPERVMLSFLTDEQGRQTLELPALDKPGRLSASARLETLDGRDLDHPAQSQPAWLVVAGAAGEAVADNADLELYTPSAVLSPGETAKVFALLPAGWGAGEGGTVWETLAGEKIFSSQGVAAQGRSRWFDIPAKPEYGVGFYHTVTVPMGGGKYREKTLGFRVVPADKRLKIAVEPERREAEPLKPLHVSFEVKRADGQPAANAELAVSIVDRAVYAVQAEFRPGAFDFFYPLQRINLATFYSDDLQGYGYADLLKKPNFSLSALKSQTKLSKKAMRDTAGWFPHVVTDAQGRAGIDVDMPANVTEWLVTVVAADLEGRLGETTDQFRTVADVSVEMLGPKFLREGEETTLTLRLVNHLAQTVNVDGQVNLLGALEQSAGDAHKKEAQEENAKAGETGASPNPAATTGESGAEAPQVAEKPEPSPVTAIGPRSLILEDKGQADWPLRIAANAGEGEAGLRVSLTPKQDIHIGGAEEFDIALEPAALAQVYAAVQERDVLRAEIPEDAEPRALKVQVSSGLLGAALQSAETLVQYPYGCTEQLVHGVIPNLALMDLIRRAGISDQDLGPLAKSLAKARDNAALGLKKIARNQKADGGFGLWPSDAEASVPVTITALYALQFAQNLGVEGAEKMNNKGLEWLRGKLGSNVQLEEPAHGYILARLAQLDLGDQPWRQQIDWADGVVKNPAASIDELVDALRLFIAYQDKPHHSFNQHFKDAATKNGLIQRLQAALAAYDPARPVGGDASLFEELGFGFGAASQISAGLGVLDELKALSPELETKLKKILLNGRRHGYWTSTFDTAQVIFNTRGILTREAEAAAKDKLAGGRKLAVLDKNGARLGWLERIPGGFTGVFADADKLAEAGEIRVEGLRPDESAYAALTAETPYDAVEQHVQGLFVERAFRRVTTDGSEPLGFDQALHVGDIVISEVSVKRREPPRPIAKPSQYLVLEDGVPSFAEALEADATYLADAKIQPKEDDYWSLVKETRRYPDKTARVVEIRPGGNFRAYQVWRVERPGAAYIPPARAFDMYDEDIQGNTEADWGEAK
jgi:hypothetical protein